MTVFKKLLLSGALLLTLALQIGSSQCALARPVRHDATPGHQVIQGINTAGAVRVYNISQADMVLMVASYTISGVLTLLGLWYLIRACRMKNARKGQRQICFTKGVVVVLLGLFTPFCMTSLLYAYYDNLADRVSGAP